MNKLHSFSLLAAAAITSLSLAACDKSDASPKPASTSAAATPAQAGGDTKPAAASKGPWTKVGVKECDDAAAKYQACLDKKPDLKAKKDEEVRGKLDQLKADLANPQVSKFVGQQCTMYFELKMMDCK
jgi:hypothetical protein